MTKHDKMANIWQGCQDLAILSTLFNAFKRYKTRMMDNIANIAKMANVSFFTIVD